VRAIELLIPDVVARAFEPWHDLPARVVDVEHLIPGAVGDEDTRAALEGGRRREPGREGHDVREEVPVRQADRQRI
jgi:hypothetical protein